ncbi:MAG: glycine oxidase ThiO [Pirellulaceae bacterium]|nr:glycine oxidase ThiO [Planctomycetales bacterium]
MTTVDDCLILGGGVIGLSLALELSRRGRRVRVLDRTHTRRPAAWAAGGMIPSADPARSHNAFERLRGISHAMYPDWIAKIERDAGIDTEFRRNGAIHLACGRGEAAALRANIAQLRDEGLQVECIDMYALLQLEPALEPLVERGGVQVAYLLAEEASVRTPRYLQALRAACRRQGVAICDEVDVHRFHCHDQRVSHVCSENEKWSAESFCIAAGTWSGQLLQLLGLTLELHPWRGQMVLFRGPVGLLSRTINVGPNYLVPRLDGRIIVGSTMEEVGFDDRTTSEEIERLITFARQHVPLLEQAEVEATWAGLRPGTGDGYPFLGRVPGTQNVFAATGHFRNGIQLAPGTALVMAQLIEGDVPQVPLEMFRLDRE